MAESAAHVYTCDIDPWVIERVAPALDKKRVTFISRDTLAQLETLPGGRILDMAFIDGLHTEAAVSADIALCRAALRKSGRIIMHDTRLGVVRAAIESAGLKLIYEFDTWYGLGVYEASK
jgi:hypothetical protein